jgi:hypothetical protein
MLLLGLLGALLPAPAWSIGLAARFGDVIVENAEIGKTYNLREVLKIPFGIENRGTADVDVVVEIEPPDLIQIKAPYEIIPDPSWIKTLPAKMRIGAKSQGFFDLLLTIPDDQKLVGRHFVAIIKAKTEGTGLLGVAVENKLRFSVGPGPESLKEEKRQKAMSRLDFDVSPQALYLMDVPAGQTFDAKKEQNKSIRVANYSTDVLSIVLSTADWQPQLTMPAGYEPIPNPSWVTFKKSQEDIEGEQIAVFHPLVRIPNDPKYKGKKYAALIRTGLKTGFWLDAPVRMYIAVKE